MTLNLCNGQWIQSFYDAIFLWKKFNIEVNQIKMYVAWNSRRRC